MQRQCRCTLWLKLSSRYATAVPKAEGPGGSRHTHWLHLHITKRMHGTGCTHKHHSPTTSTPAALPPLPPPERTHRAVQKDTLPVTPYLCKHCCTYPCCQAPGAFTSTHTPQSNHLCRSMLAATQLTYWLPAVLLACNNLPTLPKPHALTVLHKGGNSATHCIDWSRTSAAAIKLVPEGTCCLPIPWHTWDKRQVNG